MCWRLKTLQVHALYAIHNIQTQRISNKLTKNGYLAPKTIGDYAYTIMLLKFTLK